MNNWIIDLVKIAATDEENQQIALDLLKKKYEKARKKFELDNPNPSEPFEAAWGVFDPDVVLADIKRWQYQRKKNNQNVNSQIERYPDHHALHEAMENYPSKEELELAKSKEEEVGIEIIFSEPPYQVYKTSTPAALSKLAKGSNWCIQNVDTAANYIKSHGPFIIVHKADTPLFALISDGVWFVSDYDLRTGTSYARTAPALLSEDWEFINKLLIHFGKEPLKKQDKVELIESSDQAVASVISAIKKGENIETIFSKYKGVLGKGKRYPEIEAAILAQGPKAIEYYAREILRKRWPEGESILLTSPEYAFRYARNVIGGRWPEGEKIIIPDPEYGVQYFKEVINGKVGPESEELIAKNPRLSYDYAAAIIKNRWPAGEPILASNPEYAFWYSKNVLKDRFPEAEEAISTDPRWAFWYAIHVLKRRWPKAEKAILGNPLTSKRYQEFIKKNR